MQDTVSDPGILDCVRAVLAGDDRVLAAYLYGSLARRTARSDSDIDIAVLFTDRIDSRLGGPLDELRDAIERVCHRPCDIIDARAAPADLVHRILRDGILLLERSRSARIAFEVERRNEYFDLLPYLREYRGSQAR
jgi:uncharacterized protein